MDAHIEMAGSDFIPTIKNPAGMYLHLTFRDICYTAGKGNSNTPHPPLKFYVTSAMTVVSFTVIFSRTTRCLQASRRTAFWATSALILFILVVA